MATATKRRYMTVAEFADRLGVGKTTATRWVAAGEVEVINVGSRLRPRLRVSEATFEEFEKRRKVAAL
jgi:excisionase family DNA binding protein